ncbi:MAG TPA: ABC transporter permease [Candidatus Polarisedimenticolia bacterium]|nr:ABC transporter permease [Candidatus Polarisedimenticolia bacterium]
MIRSRVGTSLWENVVTAFGAMWAQKLRSALSLLGIVAGVATVILMVSFVTGFNNAVTSAFTQFGTQLVQFQKFEARFGRGPEGPPEEQRNRRDLTLEDAHALKRLGTLVAAVSPERYLFGGSAIVRAGRKEANGPLLAGVEPDYMLANSHFVEDGRFITDADVLHATKVCVVGRDIVSALFPFTDPIEKELTVNGVAYRIVGVLEHKGSFFGGSNDIFVLIPISAFDEQFPEVKNGGGLSPGDTIHIATIPRSPEVYDAWVEQGTAILRARRGLRPDQENDFALFTSQGLIENFRQITGGIAAAMIVIAGIALLVGGVGVMNIMLVNVTERTREIGIRRAIGATELDVAAQFLAEAVTLTGVGGALGIGVGFGLALLVKLLLNFPVATPPWAVLLGFAVSTIVGLLFGLWPALRAARLDPIESLRYE